MLAVPDWHAKSLASSSVRRLSCKAPCSVISVMASEHREKREIICLDNFMLQLEQCLCSNRSFNLGFICCSAPSFRACATIAGTLNTCNMEPTSCTCDYIRH